MSVGCSITRISWARVHLALDARLTGLPAGDDDVTFTIVDQEREFPVKSSHVGDCTYRLRFNVTNFRDRSQIPDGTWRIVPHVNGEAQRAAGFDLSDLERLDEDSRTFIYAGNRVSYSVVFAISEDDDRPDFLMRTYQMFRNPKPSKASARPPVATRVRQRALPRSRRIKLINQWYRLARATRRPGRERILFASEMRPKMEGNLLRLHDRLVERGLDKRFDLRFSFRAPHSGTKWGTLKLVYLLATADIVLVDDYFALLESLQLSPETKIIQAWHAGSGFKSIGYSRFGNYGSPKLRNAHRKYTYAITGSQHLVPVYAEAFGIEESALIPTGLPRIDTFLDPQRTERIVSSFFAEHPQLRGKKIILFAPTFRGRGTSTAYYDYSRIDFEKLYDACGNDAVVLFRMHHYVKTPVPIPAAFADRLLDFTSYPSTNDLLQVTDVLITDYSSIIYEFSLLDRPMLFFAYDRDVYSATRGFHRDFESTAPGKVCDDIDELVKAIKDEDFDTWKIEGFRRQNFDVVDTNAADRVIDQLILGDPRTTRVATSVGANRDPASGDTSVGDAGLTDQGDE